MENTVHIPIKKVKITESIVYLIKPTNTSKRKEIYLGKMSNKHKRKWKE